MKTDLLAIVAHPDDAEISAGGSLLKCRAQGRVTGVVDLTRGELGTRGNPALREEEAVRASALLGLSVRDNLGLPDGFFSQDRESVLEVIRVIRLYQPEVVLTNALSDRHPDHGRAARLVRDACFYSGLPRIETGHPAWRPRVVYHLVQDHLMAPGFVVDITPFWEKKLEVLRAYRSQFHDPASSEPQTPISRKDFFQFLEGRARDFGRPAGYEFAEGFVTDRTPGVRDLFELD